MINFSMDIMKKVILSFLVILCIYSLGVFAFRALDESREYEMQDNFTVIDCEQLEDYLLASSNGTVYYLMFYSNDSNDAIYLRETVLSTLNGTKSIDAYKTITIVDFSNTDLIKRNELLTKWSTQIPSFLCVNIENNTIVTDSILSYDHTKPLKASDVEAWLKENGVYFN